MTSAPNEILPVWQREKLFDNKPIDIPYGYISYSGNRQGALSMDEFKQLIRAEKDKIYVVFTPETERLVPVAEVPDLLDELQPRRIREASDRLKSQRTTLFFGLLILAYFSFNAFRRSGWEFYKESIVAMIGIYFAMFALAPLYEAWKSLRTAQRLNREGLQAEALEFRFDLWMGRQKAWVTRVFTFILVAVALYQMSREQPGMDGFYYTSIQAGLLNKNDPNFEWWRLWTAPFLHGHPIHIFFNASAMWQLGKRVEVLAKWPQLLMVFLVSMLSASFCSIHFLPMGTPGIGASGGIMGLLGFLLIFEILHPRLSPKPARRRLVAGIIMMGVIGLLGVQFIDNAAHAGGLLGGMAYAYLTFSKSQSVHRPELRPADWLQGVGALLLLLWGLFYTLVRIST